MCKMIYRTVSTCSPSCLTHNNQRATVPFKARTHISRGTDDTTVRNSVNIILTNPVFWNAKETGFLILPAVCAHDFKQRPADTRLLCSETRLQGTYMRWRKENKTLLLPSHISAYVSCSRQHGIVCDATLVSIWLPLKSYYAAKFCFRTPNSSDHLFAGLLTSSLTSTNLVF